MKLFLGYISLLMSINCFAQMKNEDLVLHELGGGRFVFATYLDDTAAENFIKKEHLQSFPIGKDIDGKGYQLENQKVLLTLLDGALLFDNKEEFNAVMDYGFYSTAISQSVMLGKNASGESFAKNTGELIARLLDNLGIENTRSYSKSLLQKVEQLIARRPKPIYFYRENFESILALLGETLISSNKELGWLMELDSDGKTWNPLLAYRKQHFPIFMDLNRELFRENNKDTPLTSVLENYF